MLAAFGSSAERMAERLTVTHRGQFSIVVDEVIVGDWAHHRLGRQLVQQIARRPNDSLENPSKRCNTLWW